jgi:hypothetical protein
MLTTTAPGPIWPARLAYAAALIFTAASGTTNLLYGWSKGTDFGSSLVWATVSLGVSIVQETVGIVRYAKNISRPERPCTRTTGVDLPDLWSLAVALVLVFAILAYEIWL